jgi:hypothetical protein
MSSRAISRVRCLYETDVLRAISVLIPDGDDDDDDDDDDRDDPRNVDFIQTPDAADSPRRSHRI